MPKLAIVAILVTLAVAVRGFPVQKNDIAAAAAAGNWDEVHRIISSMSNIKFGIQTADVRSLKPEKGGTVFAEYEATYHSMSKDANGQTNEQKDGYKIINNNGKVMEFKFTPQGF